jgi:cytochrome c oxidase assembly protein subunit 15
MKSKPKKGLFKKLNTITIIAVYFLILVGGIVRSTGSGMGCPDWPKCFGNYIPPTDESELPVNYQETYLEKRLEKNKRLAKVLSAIGLEQSAKDVLEGEMVLEEQAFNSTKTWIEYLNRHLEPPQCPAPARTRRLRRWVAVLARGHGPPEHE